MATLPENPTNEITAHHDAVLAAATDVPVSDILGSDKNTPVHVETEAEKQMTPTPMTGLTTNAAVQGKDTTKLANALDNVRATEKEPIPVMPGSGMSPRDYDNYVSSRISQLMRAYDQYFKTDKWPEDFNIDDTNIYTYVIPEGVRISEKDLGRIHVRVNEALSSVEKEAIKNNMAYHRPHFSLPGGALSQTDTIHDSVDPTDYLETNVFSGPLTRKTVQPVNYDTPFDHMASEARVQLVERNARLDKEVEAWYASLPEEKKKEFEQEKLQKADQNVASIMNSGSFFSLGVNRSAEEVMRKDYQDDPIGRQAFIKRYCDHVAVCQLLIETLDDELPDWRKAKDENLQMIIDELLKNRGLTDVVNKEAVTPKSIRKISNIDFGNLLNFFGVLDPLYGNSLDSTGSKATTYLMRHGANVRTMEDARELDKSIATAEELNKWSKDNMPSAQLYIADRLQQQYNASRGENWYTWLPNAVMSSARFSQELGIMQMAWGLPVLLKLAQIHRKAEMPDSLPVEFDKDGKLVVTGKDRSFTTKLFNEALSEGISIGTEIVGGKLIDKGLSKVLSKLPVGSRFYFLKQAFNFLGGSRKGAFGKLAKAMAFDSLPGEFLEESLEKKLRYLATQTSKWTGLEFLDMQEESFFMSPDEAVGTLAVIGLQGSLYKGIGALGDFGAHKGNLHVHSLMENSTEVAQNALKLNLAGENGTLLEKVLHENGIGDEEICITPENARTILHEHPEFAEAIGVTERGISEAEQNNGLLGFSHNKIVSVMSRSVTDIKAGQSFISLSSEALTAVDVDSLKKGETATQALSAQIIRNREAAVYKKELLPQAVKWAQTAIKDTGMSTADAKVVGQAMAVQLAFIAKEKGVEEAKKALDGIGVRVLGYVQKYRSGNVVESVGAMDTNTTVGRALFDFYTSAFGVNARLATPEDIAKEKEKRVTDAKKKKLKINNEVTPAAWYGTDGEMVINPNSGLLFLFGHEMAHLVQQASGGVSNSFSKQIMDVIRKSNTKAMQALRQSIGKRYESINEKGENLFAEGTENFDMELMGDVMGTILQDPMTARVLAEEIELRQKGNGALFLYNIMEAIGKWIAKIKELLGFLDKNAPGELQNARMMGEALLNDYTVKQRKIASILADFQATYSGNASAEVGKQVGANTRYDLAYYQKPFAESVDEILKGTYSKKGNVFVSFTPKILEEIGLPRLPIVTTQKHIKTVSLSAKELERLGISGNAHNLGSLLKQIPEALANPESVIASEKRLSGRLVVITKLKNAQGEEIIVPIALGESSHIDGQDITAHIMTSAYGKHNALSLLERAIENEKNGVISVFYLNKKYTPLLDIPRLQLPSSTKENGVTVHKITDLGSSVKSGIKNQTDTIQFRNWFKNPSQIKSATDNVGTFDRNSNNIYYALTPVSDNALIEGPKAVLEIMQNATSLDFVDAIGRWGYQMAKDLAAADPDGSLAQDMAVLDKWIDSKENPFKKGTVEHEHWKADRFTEAFKKYIVNGTVAKGIAIPLGDLKRMLTNLYGSAKYKPGFRVPMEVRQVFDSIITANELVDDTIPYDAVLSLLGEEATEGLLRSGGKSVLRKLAQLASDETKAIQYQKLMEELSPMRATWTEEAKVINASRPRTKATDFIKANGQISLKDIVALYPDLSTESVSALREKGFLREKDGCNLVSLLADSGHNTMGELVEDLINGADSKTFMADFVKKAEADYLAKHDLRPDGEAMGCETAIIMLDSLGDILSGKYDSLKKAPVSKEAKDAMDAALNLAELTTKKASRSEIMKSVGLLADAINKLGDEYSAFKQDAQAIMDDITEKRDAQDADYLAQIEKLTGRVLSLESAQEARKAAAELSRKAIRNKYSAAAQKVISDMTVKDILSNVHALSEIRHLSRGVIEELGKNKPNSEKVLSLADALMLRMEVMRQLSAAKKKVEKTIRVLKREAYGKKGRIDGAYQTALQELSYLLGISSVNPGTGNTARLEIKNNLQDATENEDLGFADDSQVFPNWLVNDITSRGYRELQYSQLEDVIDYTDFLYGRGRSIVKGIKESRTRQVADWVLGFLSDQEGLPMKFKDTPRANRSLSEKLYRAYSILGTEGVKLWRFMEESGSTTKGMYKLLSEAASKCKALYASTGKHVVASLDALDSLLDKVDFKKLPKFGDNYRGYTTWTKNELIMAVLYMGTESSRQRMVDGFGWGENGKPADGSVLAPQLRQICELLPAKALQEINNIWANINGSLSKAVRAEYRNENFFDMREIQPAPFVVRSSDGAEVKMTGGWVPLQYLYCSSGAQTLPGGMDASGKPLPTSFNPMFAEPGFTKKRLDVLANTAPPLLATTIVTNYVRDAAHYATHRVLIRQIYRALSDERGVTLPEGTTTMSFRERYVRTYGPERYAKMMALIRNLANPYANADKSFAFLEKSMKALHVGRALWGSLSVSALQLSSLTVGAEMQGKYFAGSLLDFLAHPVRSVKFALSVSPLMQERAETWEADMSTTVSKLDKGWMSRMGGFFQKAGYFLSKWIDVGVATIDFNSAYSKAIAEGATHEQAVAAAEEFVARVQGSTRPIDLLPAQLHWLGRASTPFISAAAAQQNVIAHNLFAEKGFTRVAGLVCSLLLPTMFGALIRSSMKGLFSDKKKRRDDALKAGTVELISNPFSGIPYVRDAVEFTARLSMGQRAQDVWSISNVQALNDLIQIATKAGTAIANKDYDYAIYSCCDAFSSIAGVPALTAYQRVIRMLEAYGVDVFNFESLKDKK